MMRRRWKTNLFARRSNSRAGVFIAAAAVAVAVLLANPLSVLADDDDEGRAAPPSLDELLGLPESDRQERSSDGEEAARQEAEEALRRRLEEGRQAVNAFADAINQMVVSADLLDTRFDTGIGTQRIQEDILSKLDQMISQACQQPSQSSGSSSSSGQQEQSRQPQQQPQSQPANEPGNRADSPQGEGEVEGQPPGFQQGDVNTAISETREEWGALPQRIRDMLLQGRQERFSSLYEQLTRDYYRRLASE